MLLEFLVKNGSERVVDDARSHIATIKILRNFHYIDEKAKDQGINGTTPLPVPQHLSARRNSFQSGKDDLLTYDSAQSGERVGGPSFR